MPPTIIEIDCKLFQLHDFAERRPEAYRDLLAKIKVSWIYHDSALEGIVLNPPEIVAALRLNGLEGDTSDVQLIRGVINFSRAIAYLDAEAAGKRVVVSLNQIKYFHELLAEDMPGVSGGRYRREMPLHRTYFHEIVAPQRISYHLNRLVREQRTLEYKSLHPLRQAARFHFLFMQIYPFLEYSGRVGRLLINLLLLHHGYLPLIIHGVERQHYYEALREGESALANLLMESMDGALADTLRHLPEATYHSAAGH